MLNCYYVAFNPAFCSDRIKHINKQSFSLLIVLLLPFNTLLDLQTVCDNVFLPPHPHLDLICDAIIMFLKDIRVGLKHQKDNKPKLN